MRWMLTLSILVAAVSCAQESQPQAPSGLSQMKAPEQWTGATRVQPPPAAVASEGRASSSHSPSAASAAPAKSEAPPIPPKDAQFTLYCQDYSGPSHVDLASRAKSELMAASGMRGWYAIHQEDRSILFYGYYKRADEPAIQRDRAAIEALQDKFGNQVFRTAIVVPVDAPDPVAPAEWNLANVRRGESDTRHFWTLQIAAYKGSPERKQYAVEAVREARQQGVEAYFYHGPAVSSVCIGIWPLEALKRPSDQDVSPTGTDPDQQLMIAQGDLVPAGEQHRDPDMEKAVDKGRRRNIKVVPRQIEILDPTLLKAMQTYPQHFVNGVPEGIVLANGKRVPKASMVVMVPAVDTMSPSMSSPPPPDAVRALTPDSTSGSPGTGRLRSVGK